MEVPEVPEVPEGLENLRFGWRDPIMEQVDQDDPPHVEDDDQIPRNNDGSLDGGVAVSPETSKAKASDCDLMLFLECGEVVQDHENHAVLKPGVTVCIGLDKATKLGAVFERYVAFANEHSHDKNQELIRLDDLEFVHCTLLRHNDTAENAALMKNDRICVQQSRNDERELEKELKTIQREADRSYFDDMRSLRTDLLGSCDILIDCQGKLIDENGLNQGVLRTTLRGHSAIISKRCKWLGSLIHKAREELERKSVVTVPDNENSKELIPMEHSVRQITAPHDLMDSYDGDDDGIEALPYPAEARVHQSHGATEIENDDDEDALSMATTSRSGSPVLSSASGANLLWVTIPNHPPEAVKLLLEYCYTNCVLPLGQEAFEAAWHSPSPDGHSQVRSARHWPENSKLPKVSFATALAGIALAEEANLPRLSLMCEVAASLLVEGPNVVEALSMCTRQEQLTANPLKRLRQATMIHVLRRRALDQLSRSQSFKRALADPLRSASFIPSILVGTMEAMESHDKQKQQESRQLALLQRTQERFAELDKEDAFKREMERRQYRASTREKNSVSFVEAVSSDPRLNRSAFMQWPEGAAGVTKKSKSLRRQHSSWGKSSSGLKPSRHHSRKHKKSSRSDKWPMKKL